MHHANNVTNLKPSVAVRNVNTQDGAVLLDINQGLCFSMNPVGAKIWEMLKMNLSIDRIVDILTTEFSVPREQVLEDVRSFLTQLQDHQLLVSNPETKQRPTGLLHHFFHRTHELK